MEARGKQQKNHGCGSQCLLHMGFTWGPLRKKTYPMLRPHPEDPFYTKMQWGLELCVLQVVLFHSKD